MFKRLLIVFALLASSCVTAADNDFDKVCGYFQQLDILVAKKAMSNSQRIAYISKHVNKELKASSSAREAWEVIVYAMPEERYDIYKSTAEEILGKAWQCDAMLKQIATTGK